MSQVKGTRTSNAGKGAITRSTGETADRSWEPCLLPGKSGVKAALCSEGPNGLGGRLCATSLKWQPGAGICATKVGWIPPLSCGVSLSCPYLPPPLSRVPSSRRPGLRRRPPLFVPPPPGPGPLRSPPAGGARERGEPGALRGCGSS